MNILFLGGGNMARALIGGMLRQGFAANDLCVVEINPDAAQALTTDFGIPCYPSAEAADLARRPCDLVILAVKPQQMKQALAPLATCLQDAVVLSIAAGIRLDALSRWLGGHRRLVRAMPNTPALVGAGMSGLYALPEVDSAGREMAERVLAAVGSTVWVDTEARMDAITALSGSGPAYVFLFIEALQSAALELGFTPAEARTLSIATVQGAAALAAASPEPAATLRRQVTSPGGTTEAALSVMTERGVAPGIVAGVHAAAARSAALGERLGAD